MYKKTSYDNMGSLNNSEPHEIEVNVTMTFKTKVKVTNYDILDCPELREIYYDYSDCDLYKAFEESNPNFKEKFETTFNANNVNIEYID